MANYFQDPAQSFVPTPVYRPPFEALQNNLYTRQGKYDQGLNAVRSARNSVFNAALTKGENSAVRAQYLVDADKKLSNLSQVDLSQDANVQAGTGVYSAFYDDDDIVRDMVYTKSQTAEISKSQSFKPEKDSSQYVDGRNSANIAAGMEKVRSGKRGDLSVFNVRKFVPYSDIAKDMAKQATESKFAVETVDDHGVVTVKKTNGASSLGNWTTFVDGMVGDRYGDQLRDEALYAKEEGIKKAKYANSLQGITLNDDDAFKFWVADSFKTNYKNNKDLESHYKAAISTSSIELAKLKEHQESADFPDKYQALYNHIESLKKKQTEYATEKESFDPSSKKYTDRMNSFLSNPDGNLFAQIRTQHVNNVAAALASNEKTDAPAVSNIYKEAHEAQKDAAKDARDNMKSVDEHRQAVLSEQGLWNPDGSIPGSTKSRKKADGTEMTAAEKEVAANDELHLVGQTNNKFITMTAGQKFDAEQSRLYEEGYHSLLDADGIGGMLATASGGNISYSDTVDYLSAINNGGPMSSEAAGVAKKVRELFTNNGIKLDGDDKYAIGRGIQMLTGKYLKENIGTDNWSSQNLVAIAAANKLSTEALGNYNRNNKLKTDAIVNNLSSLTFQHLLVNRSNGNKDIITAGDIDKELSGLSNNLKNYYKGDLAKAYLNGDVSIEDEMNSGGPGASGYYTGGIIIRQKGVPNITVNNPKDVEVIKRLQGKYGTSESIGKTLTGANEAIAPTLGNISDIGSMGNTYSLDFDAKKQGNERAIRVINEVLQPGARAIPFVDGKEDTDDNITNAMNIMSKWGSPEIYKYMNPPQYITQGSTGKPSIIFSINALSKADEEALKITDSSLLKKLQKGIELPIQDNKAPTLQPLLHPGDGFYIYDRLAKGKNIEASEIEKGLGFDYKVIPNDRRNPTSVKVMITRQELQPDGTMKAVESPAPPISLKDHNPDEIMDYIQTLLNQHLTTNDATKKALVTQAANAPKTDTKTANEKWLAEFEKQIKLNN